MTKPYRPAAARASAGATAAQRESRRRYDDPSQRRDVEHGRRYRGIPEDAPPSSRATSCASCRRSCATPAWWYPAARSCALGIRRLHRRQHADGEREPPTQDAGSFGRAGGLPSLPAAASGTPYERARHRRGGYAHRPLHAGHLRARQRHRFMAFLLARASIVLICRPSA